MPLIEQGELPKDALLEKYKQTGAKTDCYFVDIPKQVSQAQYIEAFYTTPLFKIERFILALVARRPSTDEQAKSLAQGEAKNFSAWSVEQQTTEQLLLCDFMGKTRSWLKSSPISTSISASIDTADGNNSTRLYFGSAVIPKQDHPSGKARIGIGFQLLGGFHHVYSKALLKAAYVRLLA